MALRKSASHPGAARTSLRLPAYLGGRLGVDFANTASVAASEQDALGSWEGLLSFLAGRNVITGERERALLEWRHTAGPATQQLLRSAVRLRTAIQQAFLAMADGAPIREAVIAPINEVLAITEGHDELSWSGGAWQLGFRAREESLEWLLAAIARSAAEIITEGARAPLRKCANPNCGLYFYDNSRTRRRRWCSMAVCGNRSKVAAFARRRHPSRASES